MLPPGPVYILQALSSLFGGPALVASVGLKALQLVGYDNQIQGKRLGVFFLLTVGLSILHGGLKKMLRAYRERQDMRALGAIPVPRVPGRPWMFGLDFTMKLQEMHKTDYVAQAMEDTAHQYGNLYNLRTFSEDMLVTLNPGDIKQILATDFSSYEKGDKFKKPLKSFIAASIVTSDGEMWKYLRGMIRPFFSRDRIADFELFHHYADKAVSLIKDRMKTGKAIDVQDLAGSFTMDTVADFIFGLSVNGLSEPLPEPRTLATHCKSSSFLNAFEAVLVNSSKRLFAGNEWPLLEFWKDKTKAQMPHINAFLDPIVDGAIRKAKGKAGVSGDDPRTLLDVMIESTDDRTLIHDELLNMLLAGRDTTAHAITAVMYFLATEDKSILRTLRREILEVVGLTATPTSDQLKGMKYLKAVINEALRLLPSLPVNVREIVKATVLKQEDGTNYYVPRGMRIFWSNIGMHRRTDLWGPDALSFDPSRWLDDRNERYYLANPFIYIPFHAGPRTCLGQQFALKEASFFLTRLLQTFEDLDFAPDAFPEGTLPPADWSVGSGRKPVEKAFPKSHLTLYFNGGMWLRFKESEASTSV